MEDQHPKTEDLQPDKITEQALHQCKHCGTVYDEQVGEPESNIQPDTPFETLPESYLCPLCESGISEFIPVLRSSLLSQHSSLLSQPV